MGDDNLLSGKNFLWLLVIGIIVVAIVVLVLSRSDDSEPKDVQDKNDRNLLPWVIGVAAVALVVGAAWYYGMFSDDKDKKSYTKSASPTRVGSTRGKTPQQVNQERMEQATSRSASAKSASPVRGSASPRAKSPVRGSVSPKSASPVRGSASPRAKSASPASSRSPPRGSLSSRSASPKASSAE